MEESVNLEEEGLLSLILRDHPIRSKTWRGGSRYEINGATYTPTIVVIVVMLIVFIWSFCNLSQRWISWSGAGLIRSPLLIAVWKVSELLCENSMLGGKVLGGET